MKLARIVHVKRLKSNQWPISMIEIQRNWIASSKWKFPPNNTAIVSHCEYFEWYYKHLVILCAIFHSFHFEKDIRAYNLKQFSVQASTWCFSFNSHPYSHVIILIMCITCAPSAFLSSLSSHWVSIVSALLIKCSSNSSSISNRLWAEFTSPNVLATAIVTAIEVDRASSKI